MVSGIKEGGTKVSSLTVACAEACGILGGLPMKTVWVSKASNLNQAASSFPVIVVPGIHFTRPTTTMLAAEPEERRSLLRVRPVRIEEEPCRPKLAEMVDQRVKNLPRPRRIGDDHVGGENITADEVQCIALDDARGAGSYVTGINALVPVSLQSRRKGSFAAARLDEPRSWVKIRQERQHRLRRRVIGVLVDAGEI